MGVDLFGVKRRRILVGVTLSEIGGAQKVVYDIISSLPKNDYEITLVTSPGGELIEWINCHNKNGEDNIKIITLSYLTREIAPLKDVKVLIALCLILKKGKYDIAHFHSSKMGILGRFAAWLLKIPKVYFTVHGWGINDSQNFIKQKIFGFLERVAGKLCTKVICVSNYDYNKGIKKKWIFKDKAVVIHNGIDDIIGKPGQLIKELGLYKDYKIVGTIARLKQPKNIIFTIKVVNKLIKQGCRLKLVIIGDGDQKAECLKLINDLNIKSKVFLLGSRTDARDLLCDIDIFTLFSKWEGLPISIIEAMLAGKPVVASNVGGVPELIVNGKNGYLLDGFDINEGASLLESLVNNYELSERMGKIGRNIALHNFIKEKMVREYLDLYSS